jgi:peptidoglycan/xylan/chitin deacetylase (PgdA/CDA1 family)
MSRRTTQLVKAALGALHYSRVDDLLAPMARGVGAILMLHQVNDDPPQDFEPNRILRVTPDFLDQTIRQVRAAGFDLVSMDDLADRLEAPDSGRRPAIAVTLDDGYTDNLTHALPVFRRHEVPFTVYIPTDYADGCGDLWWLVLEHALRALDIVDLEMDQGPRRFLLETPRQKTLAYHQIYWWLRGLDETVARAIVRDLGQRAGIDSTALSRSLLLDWAGVHALASDPLVTIGGHTRRHYALARLGEAAARTELTEGVLRLERELGRPVRHVSYPFGDETAAGRREFALAQGLGVRTAVTTRKGLLHAEHAGQMHALPRLSLNGDYQDARYVKVLLSGVPFLLRDAARRITPTRAAAPA